MKPYSSQLVESLQNWKDLGTDNTGRLIKALELYSNAIPVTESEFLQQPKSLLEQVIIAIIATDNISLDKIKKYIYDNVQDEKTKEDLVEVSHTQIDLKRVKTNHDIINKRFNLDQMNSHLTDGQVEFPQLAMIPICKLLDTYSLSLQDKFALMVEELLYLSIKYNHNASIPYNSFIIPTVHSYLFSMYPTAEIPRDTVAKVEDSIIQKMDNSLYIQRSLNEDIHLQSEAYKLIAQFEVSDKNTGDNRCIDTLYELFYNLGSMVKAHTNIQPVLQIILPLFYQYFAIARYSNSAEDLHEIIYAFNAGMFESTDATTIPECYDEKLSALNTFLQATKSESSLATSVLNQWFESDTEFKDKLDAENDYELEDEPYDVNDAPTDIFTDYDNAVLDDIEELDKVFWSNVLEESTIETFTNKDILKSSDKDLLDYIEESYEKYYPRIDKTKLLLSLNEAVKEVRKEKSTPETLTKIANLRDVIYKVKNYHDDNQDDMKDSDLDLSTDTKVMSANIVKDSNQADMMKTYTATVLGKLYNEDTVLANNIAKQAMHEMKLSSYVTLGLDKLKEGITKLSDAQKNACMQIDRFADTIERLNGEDDRREARMQVVKNSFLPSMSRCIKSIIIAGALAVLVNPFLGLVALVVRFVNSKRAAKEERQAVADEIEVELEMIDKRIRDAEDDKDYKKERKLRLLKRKLITYLAKVAVNNAAKWNNEVMFKKDIDDAGSEFGVKD